MPDTLMLSSLKERAERGLRETLDFFIRYDMDPSGGFYGAVSRDLKPDTGAARSLVLSARLLWTYAAAYRVLGGAAYLDAALHALRYLQKHFIDAEYGGGYWSLNADGTPLDDRKLVYGQAFVIYGGSELYRAVSRRGGAHAEAAEALSMARQVYALLEKHALDKTYGGYFESYERSWRRISESINIPDPVLGSKALNTHLHIIESYTNLMRVCNDDALRERVEGLVDIMSHKLLDREIFHYKPYMTDDWGTTKKLVSFGHDIEGAWLLCEAAEACGGHAMLEAAKPVALRIADACHDGIDPASGGMWYEQHVEDGGWDKNISWWVQAEAVVGFFNAWEISGDERFLRSALSMWDFIDNHVIDREGGVFREWRSSAQVPADDPRNRYPVNAWKTPYHNGRMYMELIERIDRLMER